MKCNTLASTQCAITWGIAATRISNVWIAGHTVMVAAPKRTRLPEVANAILVNVLWCDVSF